MFPKTSDRILEELSFPIVIRLQLLTDTSTVFEDEQEAFTHGGIEMLHEHGGTWVYHGGYS